MQCVTSMVMYVPRPKLSAFQKFNEGPSVTKQEFKDEADINVLYARYKKTGLINQRQVKPLEIDFEGVFDFAGALQQVNEAKRAFMSVPAAVRARFGNDPGAFVNYCMDKGNLADLRKWGLAPEEEAAIIPPVMKVEVVNAPIPGGGKP